MKKWDDIWRVLLVFVLVHMSSGASVIALSNAALALVSVGTMALAYFRNVRIDKGFYFFIYVWISLSFFYMMQFGWLNFTATIRIFLKITYVYLTMKIMGVQFFHLLEKVITTLALISLPLFIIQRISPDLMMSVNGFMEFIIPQVNKGPGVDYSNSFIFTVNPWGLERNSGFMWEPGAFSAVLSLGMALHLIQSRFKITTKFVFLIIVMATTESTTGYLLLAVVMLFWLVNQKLALSIGILPVFVLGGMMLFSSPEVSDKIAERFENRNKTIDNQDNYTGKSDGISVGRFGSFILDWDDVKKYPLIGYGLQQAERTTGKYVALVRANGLSDYMAQYGALGIFFLLTSLTVSFTRFGRAYGGRGFWLMTVMVLVLSFSNPVLSSPLFFGFQFYFIAMNKKKLTAYANTSNSHTHIQPQGLPA